MTNKLLNCRMCAEILGLSIRQVRRLLLTGKIRGEKFGYDWVVKPMDLNRYKLRRKLKNGNDE